MQKPLTEAEIKRIAEQLKKPTGELGVRIGRMMTEGNGPMIRHTFAVLDPQAGESILEIGMGDGHFIENILRLHPTINYTGLDYSELMVELSTKANAEFVEEKRAQFVHADAHDIPFGDQSFDKVFSINTIYLWERPATVIAEIRRVLKHEGRFILSIRPKNILEKLAVTKYGFAVKSEEEIKDMLRRNGFDEIAVTKVREPDQERWGMPLEMEAVILDCRLSQP